MASGQEAARLFVSVGADLSDLEKGLGRAKGELDRFAASATSVGGGGVRRLEEGARSASRGLGSMADSMALSAGKAALYGASFGLALGAVNTLSSAVGGLISSGLSMNARIETSRIQFQNLGLSGEAAKSHIAELFKLGAETPFETQPLIDASRMLRVFGGDALDTMSNLRLFGDTSAATGADLGALTFWVGRLYADLQQGKPIGEAEQNLRQLAVLSPEAATRMDQLRASGASASEIFAAFTGSLGRFNGAMETQAHTMQGLTSTTHDLLGQLAATALAPVFEANKSALEGLNKTLSSSEAQSGAEGIAGGLRGIGDAIGSIGTRWSGLPEPVQRLLAGMGVAGPAGAIVNVSAQPVGNVLSQLANYSPTALAAGAPADLFATALAMNAQQAMLEATPGGFDVAAFLRGQNPGLLAGAPAGAFANAFAPGTYSGPGGVGGKEAGSRVGEGLAVAYLQGQALAGEAGDDLFQRHAGPGTNLAKALAPSDADIAAEADQLAKAWETYRTESARITKENERVEKQEQERAEREKKRADDEAKRQAELQFSHGQAAARMGVSNIALWEQIGGMRTPAHDKAEQEKEIGRVEQERMLAQIDLAAAQHDGDEKAAARIKERIGLLDAEIARIKALGVAHEAAVSTGGSFLGMGIGRHTTNDPYHLYGGGAAVNPETNLPALPPKPSVDTGPKSEDTNIHGDVVIQVQNATSDEVLGALDSALKRLRRQPPVLAPA